MLPEMPRVAVSIGAGKIKQSPVLRRGSAKLNAVPPEAYLRDVLTRIADRRINRIAELLPWNVSLTQS